MYPRSACCAHVVPIMHVRCETSSSCVQENLQKLEKTRLQNDALKEEATKQGGWEDNRYVTQLNSYAPSLCVHVSQIARCSCVRSHGTSSSKPVSRGRTRHDLYHGVLDEIASHALSYRVSPRIIFASHPDRREGGVDGHLQEERMELTIIRFMGTGCFGMCVS